MKKSVVPIEPISKDLLYMKVADAIHSYIRANNLQPGDKIPAERELAAQLMTGRNSVREALRVLQNEGIIDVKVGSGAFVSAGASKDSIYFRLFKVNYLELMRIKTLLEREAIYDAIRYASGPQLEELEPPLRALEQEAERGVFSEALDKKFHHALLELAHNKTLAQMVRNLIEQLNCYGSEIKDDNPPWIETVCHHRVLLDAIKARDAEKALAAHDQILEIDLRALNKIASANG